MTAPNIIPVGIAGPMGSGKSTVCHKLMSSSWFGNRLHWALNTASHAAVLKRMLEAMGVPKMQLYGTQAEKAQSCEVLMGKSARQAMQTLGTEWGRKCIHPKVWLNCFNREVREIAMVEENRCYPLGSPVSCLGVLSDDVRFSNEVENIQEQGGIVIWLAGRRLPGHQKASGFKGWLNKILGRNPVHRSEQDLSKLPGVITIDNSGELAYTVANIEANVDLHLETLKGQNNA